MILRHLSFSTGLPSRKLVHGSPSIHHWLQRLSPSLKNSAASPTTASSSTAAPAPTSARDDGSSSGGGGNKSFDAHPFNLAAAASSSSSSVSSCAAAVSTSGFVVGSPVKVSPRKLSIKSPTRSPLRLPLSPNVHQNRMLAAGVGDSPIRAQQQQQRHMLLKRKRSFSSDDDDEAEGENVLPTSKMLRRSGGGPMRAKKRVFNDVVAEQIVVDGMNNNHNQGLAYFHEKLGASTSLNDLLPADWHVKPGFGDPEAGPSGTGVGRSPQRQAPPNPLPPPLPLDARLLHDAPPVSAASETTPTRPATTPRSRRFGVSGASGGRRVSSSTQKCIKFNQEPPPPKNQTILKYFAKKN